MRTPLDRKDSIGLAKAYIVEHSNGSLSKALADPSCPRTAVIAALLHACGYYRVFVDEADATVEFSAGPTDRTASPQITFKKDTRELSGAAAVLIGTVYLLWLAIEHELDAALYLPPDMRRERVLSVCNRLGIDEDFVRLVLRNQAA